MATPVHTKHPQKYYYLIGGFTHIRDHKYGVFYRVGFILVSGNPSTAFQIFQAFPGPCAEKAADDGRRDGFTGFHVLGSMRHKVSVSQRRRRQSFRSLPDNGSENRFNVVEEKIWAGSHIYRFHHFHLNLNLPD